MIQSLRPMNATPIRNNTSFGQDENKGPLLGPAGRCETDVIENREKRQQRTALAKYIGTQFVSGAIVSAIFDGIFNLYHTIRKNTEGVKSISEISKSAGVMGVAFAVIGAVFAAVDMFSNKNK